MKANKLILLLFLLSLFSCEKEEEYGGRGNFISGPDPGTNPIEFEWLSGNHHITGYPYWSEDWSAINNDKYHVGYTFKAIQVDSLPENEIQSYSIEIRLVIGSPYQTYTVLYKGVVIPPATDSITVIYDCYYLRPDSNVNAEHTLWYRIDVTCKERLCVIGWDETFTEFFDLRLVR